MAIVELRDRGAIARFCRRRPAVHAYELGDLDDFFWPYTRWFGWRADGRLEQLALLYDEPDLPVLLALAEEPESGMRDLLRRIAADLPPRVVRARLAAASSTPSGRCVVADEPAGCRICKLGLADPAYRGARATRARRCCSRRPTWPRSERFYADAYPGTVVSRPACSRPAGTRGSAATGAWRCVAGVHVWSPRWRVAALGNVATLPEHRGSGLATAACARLCRVLLDDGIDVISLNVRADNAAAIRAYGTPRLRPRRRLRSSVSLARPAARPIA